MGIEEIAYLAARVLSCGLWLIVGLYKIAHYGESAEDMARHGIPGATLPLVLALLLGGSALVIADLYVWAVSLAWIAFLVPASFVYHGKLTGDDGRIDFFQLVLFWKNVSMAGGLLALVLLDPSRPAWLLRG
jgi:putative oxidoreductase